MITNGSITYYHKKRHIWNRYVFEDVWHFGGKSSSINKGYENANDVNIRIPMEYVEDKNIFTIGDIIAINVTSITINEYGNNPHVHLGGK